MGKIRVSTASKTPPQYGGEAFPLASNVIGHHLGMSLRDYFAAKAMQVVLHHSRKGDTAETIAVASYNMADAMIKARKDNYDRT